MFIRIKILYPYYLLKLIILPYLNQLNSYVLILINILFHMILYINFMCKLYLKSSIILINHLLLNIFTFIII